MNIIPLCQTDSATNVKLPFTYKLKLKDMGQTISI